MKILVIQQKRIGDVLTSTILSNNLKEFYPEATIDYMCYPNCVAVLQENPNINEIIVLSNEVRKSYRSLFKFIFQIRNKKYDVVIDAYSKLETNLITLFSGAKFKISYSKGYSKIFYNHNIERIKIGTTSNLGLAIDNRLLLLKPLIKDKITNYKPKIFLTDLEIIEAQQLFEKHTIQLNTKPVIMFGILGSEWYKTYPLDKMAKIIDFAVEKLDAEILFNYIPSQKEEALKVFNFCTEKTKKNIHLDFYGTSLRSFLAILSQCSMLIGNEGGAVNMAKALNIPTFSLFSPCIDKETWQIFEDEKENVSIHLKDLKPEIYKEFNDKYIKEHTFKYFDEYPLEIILEKLETYFLDLNFPIK
ncbi:glycosyltransferase family 9 protein [Flavobacterium cellulosilyticum]|uniref:Lipopolysaccharide heptosyltransferase family protein n=1 Tax=Flavobacterium cellulosilyticum TaxID=2541731 RepID=A0A4R5CHU4_9FLAO|nr:glycosyltransferase family 9 protein [Flavobacterium cellulosilyticum]TDD98636.1 lipopolysaccharide heptosyltransferase family protein [Flavobacterium cellulosilyticum]